MYILICQGIREKEFSDSAYLVYEPENNNANNSNK